MANQEQIYHPFLAKFAVERIDSDAIPGRYSDKKDVWIIEDESGNEVPIILRADQTGPITKVAKERNPLAILEVSTKTAHQIERDDDSPMAATVLPELATKTEAARERDDVSPPRILELLELVTKTLTQKERDDQ